MQRIEELVGKFLEERRESDGGWAPVEWEDLEQLCTIIDFLVDRKWSADPDGDRPIQYRIVDRTKGFLPNFMAVPYLRRDKKAHFDALVYNLDIAVRDMQLYLKVGRLEKTE